MIWRLEAGVMCGKPCSEIQTWPFGMRSSLCVRAFVVMRGLSVSQRWSATSYQLTADTPMMCSMIER